MNRDSKNNSDSEAAGPGSEMRGKAGTPEPLFDSERPGSTAPAAVRVEEYATQAISYIHAALGVLLDYTGDTLPVVDHYLRNVPKDRAEAIELVVATTGAYFGEVVRRSLGGQWNLEPASPTDWRLILPTGLSFVPAGLVAAAILQSDDLELDSSLDASPALWPHVEAALARMSQVTAEEYFSLCGRFDTLEHLHAVLTAILAQRMGS